MRKTQAVPDQTGIYRERWTSNTYRVTWNRKTREWEARTERLLSGFARVFLIRPEDFRRFTENNGWVRVTENV